MDAKEYRDDGRERTVEYRDDGRELAAEYLDEGRDKADDPGRPEKDLPLFLL